MASRQTLVTIGELATGLLDHERRKAKMVDVATAKKKDHKYAFENGFVTIDVTVATKEMPYGVPEAIRKMYITSGVCGDDSFAEEYVKYLNRLAEEKPVYFDGFRTTKAICIVCDDRSYEQRVYGLGDGSGVWQEKARFVFRNWLICYLERERERRFGWGTNYEPSAKVAHIGEIMRPSKKAAALAE